MLTLTCAGVALLSRSRRDSGDGMFAQLHRHRDGIAPWVLGDIGVDCACRHNPFGFERDNSIDSWNVHAGRSVKATAFMRRWYIASGGSLCQSRTAYLNEHAESSAVISRRTNTAPCSPQS